MEEGLLRYLEDIRFISEWNTYDTLSEGRTNNNK